MNFQEIIEAWSKDCIIDKLNLDNEAINIGSLHFKYTTELSRANLQLFEIKNKYNKVALDRYLFYVEGAKNITDYKKAPRGAVLKSEAEKYILADDDFIAASKEVALAQEKVDYLKSIITALSKRNFEIRAAIDHRKFVAGV